MKSKKTLSILLAVVLIASAAVLALAESADVTTQETPATATEETATTQTYSLDEMLTQAMADAYTRQAAYAAYAEAFTDSQSMMGISVDSQIVLLEMLLKANDVALPAANTDVTVPQTKAEAYQAIAEAESNTVSMMTTYLAQEALPEDAQMIFQSVRNSSYKNAVSFASKARTEQKTQEWTELLNSEDTKVIVVNEGYGRGRGGRTVYVYSTSQTDDQTTELTDDAQDTTDTTDTTAEDSVSD